MGQFTFDERDIQQLYVATKDWGTKLIKARNQALGMQLSAPAISEYDDQLKRNKNLRECLDPAAEERAREAARKKRGERSDPRQLDLEHEIKVSAEPNGKRAKKPRRVSTATVVDGLDVANPTATQEPTDELLSTRLWEVCGLTIGVDVIHKWTSSEHEAADKYATVVQLRNAAIASGQEAGLPPEPPHCIWSQLWRGQYDFNPRGSQLMLKVPSKERDYWADQGPFTIRRDGSGSQAKFFVGGVLDGELQELEVLDKQGLSRMKDSAVVHAARLNQQWHGRSLVGGKQYADTFVLRGMLHPGKGARYIARDVDPVQPNDQPATEAR